MRHDADLYAAAQADVRHCRELYLGAFAALCAHPGSTLAYDALDSARRALSQALVIRDLARGDGGD